MDELELERRLSVFDFSGLSSVREPLLQKLLSLRRSRAAIAGPSDDLWARRIDDELLDEVAAAGRPLGEKKPKRKN